MQAVHDTSFESRLASINLTKVMAHVVEDHGLNTADTARAEDLYRTFLTLIHRHPGQSFVPPRLVDLVWHAHITETRNYMADCDKLFGKYIHHEMHTPEYVAGLLPTSNATLTAEFGPSLFASLTAEQAMPAICSIAN